MESPRSAVLAVLGTVFAALLSRIIYNQYFHPLSKFRGPWYATSFSVVLATISQMHKEPDFLMYLVRKYGSDRPIRISPNMLMFPRPSALRDIYWNPRLNQKSRLYGSGALGPPHLFTTLDGEEHKQLRKALSNAPWTIGPLKNTWEYKFDKLVSLFVQKLAEHAAEKRVVCVSDKLAEFASDLMSMITFGTPFGCVENQRDEKSMLHNWRQGLDFFGFAGRFRFFRDHIIPLPVVGLWFLPSTSNHSGMGWLLREADSQVSAREEQLSQGTYQGEPDFMQHCLDARFPDGSPLNPSQKRAHITLLIMAGADTTGTAMGSILRFMITNPDVMARARAEIDAAEQAGYLSEPVQYEETRSHLPYFVACIKEGLRLNPPATNLFSRVVASSEGVVIDGVYVPPGTDVTCHAYSIHRYPGLHGNDSESFKPERWLTSNERTQELESSQFTFGVGPRTCIGKDVSIMEMYKLLPEVVRNFDIELVKEGKYVVAGGVAYNKDFCVRFVARHRN